MITLRNTLRILFSRHPLPYLYCGVAIQFPLVARISTQASSTQLFHLLIHKHEESKMTWEKSSFLVQLRLYHVILFLCKRTSRLSKFKLMRRGSSACVGRGPGVMVSDAPPVSTQWVLDPSILDTGEETHFGWWFKAHNVSWRISLHLCKVFPLAEIINESSKCQFNFSQVSSFRIVETQ